MRKILISFLIATIGLCAYAANWEKISDKIYLDVSGISAGKSNGEVTFWVKELNDGGMDFQLAEKKYSQKVWYDLVRYSIDCNSKKFKIEDVLVYGLQNNLLGTDSTVQETWHIIPPQSIAEDYMELACKHKPEAKPVVTPDEKARVQKISTPPPITFTEVKPDAPLIRMEVVKPKK